MLLIGLYAKKPFATLSMRRNLMTFWALEEEINDFTNRTNYRVPTPLRSRKYRTFDIPHPLPSDQWMSLWHVTVTLPDKLSRLPTSMQKKTIKWCSPTANLQWMPLIFNERTFPFGTDVSCKFKQKCKFCGTKGNLSPLRVWPGVSLTLDSVKVGWLRVARHELGSARVGDARFGTLHLELRLDVAHNVVSLKWTSLSG